MLRSLVVAIAAVAGCSTAPSIELPRAGTDDYEVVRGDLEDYVVLTGKLESADSVQLVVPRTNTWQLSIRWLADDGSRVDAGGKVVEFDNGNLMQRLLDLELAIVRADNDLASQRATDAVALADKELEVERQRVEVAKAELDANLPRALVSRREWEDNRIKLERARTAHANAIDDLESFRRSSRLEQEVKRLELGKAERNYERVAAQLDSLVIRAPRAGVVVVADHPWFGRRLQLSDVVQPGFAVAQISNLGAMKVSAHLSDVDDGRVSAGMPARCVLDAYPDRVFRGVVSKLSEIAREHSQTSTRRFFEVTVELDDTDVVMRPGMSVRVDVLARVARDAVLAPRAAVPPGGSREVDIDFCTARHCVVNRGLEPGQRLSPLEDER